MKRYLMMGLVGLALSAAPAAAQVSVYGGGGAAFPSGEDLDGVNTGVQVVAGLVVDINDRLGIYGEGQWGSHGLESSDDGSANPTALMAGLILGLSGNEDAAASPYVFGGFGLQKISADDDDGDPSDSTTGWQAGAGVGFDLFGGSFLEGRYQSASFDSDSEFGELDFAIFSVIFGISIGLGGDN